MLAIARISSRIGLKLLALESWSFGRHGLNGSA